MRSAIVRGVRSGLLSAFIAAASSAAAWAAGTAEPVEIGNGGITYQTRAGDTLTSIATRFTAAPANWLAIGKLNGIGNDTAIRIGTTIQIPATLLIDEPSEAQVVALFGTVRAIGADHRSVLLKIGTLLTEGMALETANNSFVSLKLPDESRVSLPSNSRILLAKLRMARYTKSPRTEITILRGQVESTVSPLDRNSGRFEIRSPHAIAAVRGTQFRVGILPNGDTSTELLSGTVEIHHLHSAQHATLHSGEGNVVGRNQIGNTARLLAAPQLEPASPSAQHGAPFQLTTLPDARGYHLQLSTDPEGRNPFAEARSNKPEMRIATTRSGDFFLRMSGFDAYGLEGQTRTVPVHLDSSTGPAGERPAAPTLDASDPQHFHLKWSSPPSPGFNLQVGRDADFSWLQFDSHATGAELVLPRPPFGTYFVRVRRQNADGSRGEFSDIQSFVVTDQWIIPEGLPIAAKHGMPR